MKKVSKKKKVRVEHKQCGISLVVKEDLKALECHIIDVILERKVVVRASDATMILKMRRTVRLGKDKVKDCFLKIKLKLLLHQRNRP